MTGDYAHGMIGSPRDATTGAEPRHAQGAQRHAGATPGVAPSGRVMAGAVAVLAALVALALYGEWVSEPRPSAGLLALDIAVGVLGCIALPLLPRFPAAGAAALGALGAVSAVATPLAGTSLLWLASRLRLPVSVAVAAIGVIAQVIRGLWRPIPMPLEWWFVFYLAVFAAIVGWGAMARARRAVIASLRERARRAEADQARRAADARRAERARIAREMHDVLAHRLSLLATFAGALEYHPDAPPEQLARAATEIRTGAHQALEELREVIGVLRDDAASGAAIQRTERPQPTLADMSHLIRESRDAGMSVHVDDGLAGASVPAGIGRTAYRVVQEALTNARKHAVDQPVRITLSGAPGGELVVEVRNPVGDGPAAAPGSGSGIIGLTERVDLAGGGLEHGVTAGEFRLRASLPWPA
jgi:signal transduction histidine kinase